MPGQAEMSWLDSLKDYGWPGAFAAVAIAVMVIGRPFLKDAVGAWIENKKVNNEAKREEEKAKRSDTQLFFQEMKEQRDSHERQVGAIIREVQKSNEILDRQGAALDRLAEAIYARECRAGEITQAKAA